MDTSNVGTEETFESPGENDDVDKASPWAFYAVMCTLVCAIIYLLASLMQTWSLQ